MAVNVIQILEKTISPDKNELETAQRFLDEAANTDLAEFLKTLSDVLKHPGNSTVARTAAGLYLKNAFTAKDDSLKQQKQQTWLSFADEVRSYIKQNVLQTLGTEQSRPSSAAQCVAYVAIIELPHGAWNELIERLVINVTNPASTEMLKESSLEAIGYICQEIEPGVLTAVANEILTAIVHGMKKDEPSNHVKLAATNALQNSLEFTKANFEKESERHFIMQVVCEATQSSDTNIRVAALQCLVKIMSLYYQYMEHYMGPALFAITMEAMKSDVDEIALQGVEFWSNVCDEESDLAIEASEAADLGRPPEHVSRFYAKGALQYLMPILLQTLTKQEEFDDEDDWNPCKAAGVCIMLMATCCEDDVVTHVIPFVHENIQQANWKHRDAAIMAFGSILEGPDSTTLKSLAEQAMPLLIQSLHDPSVIVRDTAAWCIGRVCELLSDAVVGVPSVPGGTDPTLILPKLLDSLIQGLAQEPRVASNVCWAFSSLAEAAYEKAEPTEEGDEPATYHLSAYFQTIIDKLLETTDREDGNQSNLRSAAYEALMEMVKNSPKDCYTIVQRTMIIIMERFQKILVIEDRIQSSSDKAQFQELQSLLCATLQSLLRKVSSADAPQISDMVMSALLQMFQRSAQENAGSVQEDALMAVSTLIEVLSDKFMKYMESFKPYLHVALRNTQEYQVCSTAVGLVGDLCRALGSNILPYCDELMMVLLENLGNEAVHRSVKPQILSVFGDLALAIGAEFKKYFAVVIETLKQASQVNVSKDDYDMVDYLNELRESCLEAYTGIVQGLKGDSQNISNDVRLLQPHVLHMVAFIEHIAQDPDHTDGNISACAGLIGDLVSVFGADMLPYVDKEDVSSLLTKGRHSRNQRTKTLAQWATKEIRRLAQSQQAAGQVAGGAAAAVSATAVPTATGAATTVNTT